MTVAILGLIAAVAAALISRSVMIGNHRQAWINGLRDDLAIFFAGIDAMQLQILASSPTGEAGQESDQHKVRNETLLAYRKILMRLNLSEPPHQELEQVLASLLMASQNAITSEEVNAAVTIARRVLKREWEVTKYGLLTGMALPLKRWWRQLSP